MYSRQPTNAQEEAVDLQILTLASKEGSDALADLIRARSASGHDATIRTALTRTAVSMGTFEFVTRSESHWIFPGGNTATIVEPP